MMEAVFSYSPGQDVPRSRRSSETPRALKQVVKIKSREIKQLKKLLDDEEQKTVSLSNGKKQLEEMNKSLEMKIKDMRIIITELRASKEANDLDANLPTEIQELKKENESLREKSKLKDELKLENKRLEIELADANQEVKTLLEQIAILKETAKQCDAFQQNEGKYSENCMKLLELQSENLKKEMTEEIRALSVQRDFMIEQKTELQEKLLAAAKENEDLILEMSQKTLNEVNLKGQLDRLKDDWDKLMDKLSDMTDKLKETEQNYNRAKDDFELQLQNEQQQHQDEVQHLKNEVGELEKQLSDHQQRSSQMLAECADRIDEECRRSCRLENQLLERSEELVAQKKDFEDSVKTLREEIGNARLLKEEEINAWKGKLSGAENELEIVKTTLASRENDLQQAISSYELRLQNDSEKHQNEISKLGNHYEDLQNQERARIMQINKEYVAKISDFQEQLCEQLNLKSEMERQVLERNEELASFQKLSEDRLNTLQEELDVWKEKFLSVERELDNTRIALKSTEDVLQETKSSYELEHQNEMMQLRTELDDLRNRETTQIREEYSAKISDLQEQMNGMRYELEQQAEDKNEELMEMGRLYQEQVDVLEEKFISAEKELEDAVSALKTAEDDFEQTINCYELRLEDDREAHLQEMAQLRNHFAEVQNNEKIRICKVQVQFAAQMHVFQEKYNAKLTDFQQQIQKIREKRCKQEQQMQDKNEEYDSLRKLSEQQTNILREELANARKEKDENEVALNEKLHKVTTELETLHTTLQNIDEQCLESAEQIAKLKETLLEESAHCHQLENEKKALVAEKDSLEDQISKLNNKLNEGATICIQSENEKTALVAKIEELQKQCEQTTTQLHDCDAEIIANNHYIASLKEESGKMIMMKDDEAKELRDNLHVLTTELEQCKSALKTVAETLNANEGSRASEQQKYAAHLEKVTLELKTAKKEKAKEIAEYETATRLLREELSSESFRCSDLQNSVQQLQCDREVANSKLQLEKDENEKLSKMCEQQLELLKETEQEKTDLEKKYHSLKADVCKYASGVSELKNAHQLLQQEFAKFKSQANENKFAVVAEYANNLSSANEEREIELRATKTENTELQSRIRSLSALLAKSEDEMKSLTTNLNNIKKRNDGLERIVKKLGSNEKKYEKETLLKKYAEMKVEVSQTLKLLGAEETKSKKLQNEQKLLHQNYADEMKSLHSMVQEKSQYNAELSKKLKLATSELYKKDKENKEIRDAANKSRELSLKYREQADQVNEILRGRLAEIDKLRKRLEYLSSEKKQLELQLQKSRRQLYNEDTDQSDLLLSTLSCYGTPVDKRRAPPVIMTSFTCAEEDGQFMESSKNLQDLMAGRCGNESDDEQRLQELQRRNTCLLPHMRSSYAVETHGLHRMTMTEREIKSTPRQPSSPAILTRSMVAAAKRKNTFQSPLALTPNKRSKSTKESPHSSSIGKRLRTPLKTLLSPFNMSRNAKKKADVPNKKR